MERILVSMQHRLAERVPELQTIDFDISQIDNDEEGIRPAAFVAVDSVEWQTTRKGVQQGQAVVTVRVVPVQNADTLVTGGVAVQNPDAVLEEHAINRAVYKALQGFRGIIIAIDPDADPIRHADDNFSPLSRNRTAYRYTEMGTRFCETTFACTVVDNDVAAEIYTTISESILLDKLVLKPEITA